MFFYFQDKNQKFLTMTSENEKKTVYKSEYKDYVEIKIIGKGGFANVYLVEEEISKEK